MTADEGNLGRDGQYDRPCTGYAAKRQSSFRMKYDDPCLLLEYLILKLLELLELCELELLLEHQLRVVWCLARWHARLRVRFDALH